jgi:pimeloyl-ACP methyl ester carboxylesterase
MSFNYHREGSGPPLVLLHGVGHHWQAWRPVIDELRAEFDIIACDSPGFGRSAPLAASIKPTIPAYAEAFERFFAELGLERPHVAGNSMGGAIALELARARAVRSASAFSPAGFWTPGELRFALASLGALARMPMALRPGVTALARTRAGRVALFGQLFGWPKRLPAEEAVATLEDAWGAPALNDTLAAFHDYSFSAPQELREVPVTIAWGVRDRLLLYGRQAPRARALLPWARHLTLGAGHVPFFDDPAAVAEVIRSCACPEGTAGDPGPSSRAADREGRSGRFLPTT